MSNAIKYICEAVVAIVCLLVSPFGWVLAIILALPLVAMCEAHKDTKLTQLCIESCAPISSRYDDGSCYCGEINNN